jgi:fido (protein-threonine AMPylation protein)
MSKTTPSYRETKFGILSVAEIEGVIFDNLIQTKAFLLRNYRNLDWSIETFLSIHRLLCASHFEEAGIYRRHEVQVGDFIPIPHFQIAIEMKNLEDDMRVRGKFV